MFRVSGEVVRYERKPWEMEGRTGITRTARVLVGRADFVDVKIPAAMPEPRENDVVDWAVSCVANGSRLSANLVGDFLSVVPSAAPVLA